MLASTFVKEMVEAGYTPKNRLGVIANEIHHSNLKDAYQPEVYWEDVIKAVEDIKEKKCQMTSDARGVALYLLEIRKKEQKQGFLDIKGDFVDAYDDARQEKLDLEVPSDEGTKASV